MALCVVKGALVAGDADFRGSYNDGLGCRLGGENGGLGAGSVLVIGKSAEAGYENAAEDG
jgi:hypothetical protein